MSREIAPTSAEARGAAEPDHGHIHGAGPLKDTAEAIGTLFAAVTRMAIGGFERWADRRAEHRSARIRSRTASDRRPRVAGRGANGRRS